MSTTTSSASGSTATVTVEVCMRPCDSVSGTRWTRCTPLSYLRRANTPSPLIFIDPSLSPPSSVAFMSMSSTRQPCFSAYILYIRMTSMANSAASSPPAPPRISIMTFLSSSGSLGSNRIFSSRSVSSILRRFSSISERASSASSASSEFSISTSSARFFSD